MESQGGIKMLGAIFGDIAGSVYEFHNIKTEEFPLLRPSSSFTDDTVMTIAVAKALEDCAGENDAVIKKALIKRMHEYGRYYPYAGYGGHFDEWLTAGDTLPYNSYGNGSGMRVSSVGWLYRTLDETLRMAQLTAEVTHNHPEGIKGARAIAAAVYLSRTGSKKDMILNCVKDLTHYDLDFTLDEIRPDYGTDHFPVSCQESVPQAIRAFYESTCYEDAIRKAVSIGGDSDTVACMTGAIAEAYYGMPDALKEAALNHLDERLRSDALEFRKFYHSNMVLES